MVDAMMMALDFGVGWFGGEGRGRGGERRGGGRGKCEPDVMRPGLKNEPALSSLSALYF